MKFESLNLHPDILKGVSDAGFEHCTPIQEQSLPECLSGKDVIAQSQTGSGKTAVFLLTIFSRVLSNGPDPNGRPKALVMVPTRELATQVIDDCVKLGKHLPFRSVAIYGGVEYNKQINSLKTGVELVVATPGRMIDLYKSRTLSLDSIEMFVIDEADRMFDMGFAPDIMYIAGRLPKNKPRQTMLFSATIDSNVRRLASRYMKPDPAVIEIEPEQVTVNAIDQKIVYVSNEEKLQVMLTLVKRADVERSIIFTNMKRTAETLGGNLAANGIPAKVLTGDLSQERRQKIIEGMKSGKIKTLVATDVAARGLHIEDVSHVFNYDLPDDAANYVHRIGRTARAGKSGKAYSLVCEDHVLNLPDIEKYIERKLESEWIEDSELVKDIVTRARPAKERFEKRDRKPGAGRHEKRSSPQKDRKPHQPRPEKRDEAKAGEKGAERAGQQARPKGRRRPERKEGQTGPSGAKPQGQPQERRNPEERPRRHNPHRQRTDRPGAQGHRVERHEHGAKRERDAAHHAVKPEAHPRPKAEPVKETKEKKPGLLKRFLGLLKKPKS